MTGGDPRLDVITRLVAELSAFLQEPIERVEPADVLFLDDEGWEFSCKVRSPPPRGDGFRLCWEGLLGAGLAADGNPHVSVTIFLYSRNRRLGVTGDAEGSSLEIDYEGSLEHGGRWVSPRWLHDEFGEFLGYESYGDGRE
ncbi:hypothetical protein [Actinomadura fibrosa]|uniref:Uncharacterized protein n=1 Tax=Actinomadura fibrosa TaxID=111802 RepID=A0ABW2Y466_9ACTN|nr:hypothetical protein [Actinomadura fibrosa]